MRIKRRTAILLIAAAIAASVAGFAFVQFQPERLRKIVLGVVQGALAEGYEAELDGVEFDVGAGVARANGLRVFRVSSTESTRELVVSVPGLEAEVRSWEFLRHGRVSLLRLKNPEVNLDVSADGKVSLAGVLRETPAPGPEEPAARPRVLVEGGRLRVRLAGILAEGEAVSLRIESADLQESRSGRASTLDATLVEEGSPARGGAGAFGRIVIQGDVPFAKRGLGVSIEKFTVDDALLARLAPEYRDQVAAFGSVSGVVGEGANAPGIEVRLSAPTPDTPLDAAVVLRPRGLRIVAKQFPLPVQEVRGLIEATIPGVGGWRCAKIAVKRLSLRRPRGEIHLQADGRFEDGEPVGIVRFWGRDITFDRELHDAMPENVRAIWDAYHLGGVVDFTAAPRGTDGSFDSSISRAKPGDPVEVIARAQLVDGSLSYKGYPDEKGVRWGFDFPVRGATGRLEFRMPVEGTGHEITLADLRGFTITGGPAVAHGTITEFPGGRARVDIHVQAGEVALDDTVRRGSPGMEERFATWSPRGFAKTIHVHVNQDPDLDKAAGTTITMTLDGRAGFTWKELPLPVDALEGIIEVRDQSIGGKRVPVTTVRGLRGRVAEGSPVSADGTVEGDVDPRLQITVDFRNLHLDRDLKPAAIAGGKPRLLEIFEKMNPRGPVDLHAVVSGTDARRREVFEFTLHGVDADGWDRIEWPATGITGTVRVSPEEIVLDGLRGRGPEGPIAISGRIHDPDGAATLDLEIRAEGAPLDGKLRERVGAVAKRLEGYYDTVVPGKGLRGDATVRLRGSGDDIRPDILLENLEGPVAPFGLRGLDVRGGSVRLDGDIATFNGVEAGFEDRSFRIESGSLDLDRGTGSLRTEVRRLRFPHDLVPIISEDMAATCDRVAPDRWIHAESLVLGFADGFRTKRFDGAVVLSPPREGATGGLGLEGVFDLRGVTMARGPNLDDPSALSGQIGITGGRFKAGVEVTEMEATVDLSGVIGERGNTVVATVSETNARVRDWKLDGAGAEVTFPPDGVLVKDLRGTLAGGALDATIQSSDGRPSLDAKISLANAEARSLFVPGDAKSEMEGTVDAFLWVTNPTGRPEDMIGEGRLELRDGRLFKVPLFELLYRVVGSDASPEFEQMRLQFDISGDRVRFEEILLQSTVMRLHKASGASYAWLDGRLDVRLRAAFETGVIEQIPLLGWIWSALSITVREALERVFAIHVAGTLQNPDVGIRGAPTLFGTDPQDKPRFLPPPPAVQVEPSAPIRF